MEPITQSLITLATGLILSIVTAVITVRLSIRQFHSQRWWDHKWGQYSRIIEALYHIRHYNDRLRASEEAGKELSAGRKAALVAKSSEASDEIDKAIALGAFAISASALASLKRLRAEVDKLDLDEMSFFEFLDRYVGHLDNCISEVTICAKQDLGLE